MKRRWKKRSRKPLRWLTLGVTIMLYIGLKIFFFLTLLGPFSLQAQSPSTEGDPTWVKDGKIMLSEDMKEAFRAKDRLKDLDHLDQLLQRELTGHYSSLVLKMVKELKLRSLLGDLKDLARKKEDKELFQIANSLTSKEDLKQMINFYEELRREKKVKSYLGYVQFADRYNLVISFNGLAEMFQAGDEEDKIEISRYLMIWREEYKNHEISFFINTALGTAPTSAKLILVNGMRALPDPIIAEYSINYKVCFLDADKKLANLCKMLKKFSKE